MHITVSKNKVQYQIITIMINNFANIIQFNKSPKLNREPVQTNYSIKHL